MTDLWKLMICKPRKTFKNEIDGIKAYLEKNPQLKSDWLASMKTIY